MKATGERGERRRWRIQRPERVAAVDKIEGKRKPEDFIGHRKRPRACPPPMAESRASAVSAAVDKIEEKRKPEDFIGHRKRGM